jgi:hypothetical protein
MRRQTPVLVQGERGGRQDARSLLRRMEASPA